MEQMKRVTMRRTMTTLIEDGSNNCQSSGPVNMSDGVRDPAKKHQKSGALPGKMITYQTLRNKNR